MVQSGRADLVKRRLRTLLPGLLAFHLVAITVAAIPSPQALPVVERSPTRGGAVTARVTSVLDQAALSVTITAGSLWRWTRDLRVVTTPYVNLTAQHQRWHMFSGPVTRQEYMRVRYYVRPDGNSGKDWTATEVVLPSHARSWWRLWSSFRYSFRDKAILTALGDFRSGLSQPSIESPPDDLGPVARYFTRSFERGLKPNEHVVRTEVWYGTVPIAPPGARPVESTVGRAVDAGPIKDSVVPSYGRPSVRQQDGGVSWTLLHVERPSA